LPTAFQEGSALPVLWVFLPLLFPLHQQLVYKTSVHPAAGEDAVLHIKPVVRVGWMLHAFANLICHVAERPPLAQRAGGMHRLVSRAIACSVSQ